MAEIEEKIRKTVKTIAFSHGENVKLQNFYKKLISAIVILLSFISSAICGTRNNCRLIPEAIIKLPNLLKNNWKIGEVEYPPERAANFKFSQEKDISNNSAILVIESLTNKHSGYWSAQVKLQGGHKYLTYFRVLNQNGNILLWMRGVYGKDKKLDERIQVNTSTSGYLIPLYLSPEYTTKLNAGWQTMHRIFTVPAEAGCLDLCFAVGSFFGEGTIKFTDIVLVDITQEKDLPLQADISVTNKKIKDIRIHLQRTEGDVIFEKHFHPGVNSYNEVIPGTSSEKAYGMEVIFDDSSSISVFSPAKKQTLG